MSSLPQFPRLDHTAMVRRFRSEAGDAVVIVAQHERSRRTLPLHPDQWRLIALADGTRDERALLEAAREGGLDVEPESLRRLLSVLAAANMLGDGPAPPVAEEQMEPDADLRSVPLDPIDGWRLECDGSGTCCQMFPTILFKPADALRAKSLLPQETHEFFPAGGADGAHLSPLLVDGHCAYLQSDGRCRIHAQGGPHAKPAGCQSFPLRLLFDGERIRASVAFECACVAAGVDRASGSPSIPEGARVLGDLVQPPRVLRLPDRVSIDSKRTVTQAEARAFFRALADAPAPDDVACGLFSLADALRSGSLDASAYSSPAALDRPGAHAALAAFQSRLRFRSMQLGSYRSGARDLTMRAIEWVLEAASRMGITDAPPRMSGPPDPSAGLRTPAPPAPGSHAARVEAFYVRSLAWACRDALGARPLERAVRARAVSVWLARALPAVAHGDPYAREPLPLVEALFRVHDLADW